MLNQEKVFNLLKKFPNSRVRKEFGYYVEKRSKDDTLIKTYRADGRAIEPMIKNRLLIVYKDVNQCVREEKFFGTLYKKSGSV